MDNTPVKMRVITRFVMDNRTGNIEHEDYYFYQGEVKTYGDTPTNLYTDASSLGQVNNSINEKQNIEIVTIVINTESELNSGIDLVTFLNFNYAIDSYEC